jgi:hypothetical protein
VTTEYSVDFAFIKQIKESQQSALVAAMIVWTKWGNITTDKVCEIVNKMESCDGYVVIIENGKLNRMN